MGVAVVVDASSPLPVCSLQVRPLACCSVRRCYQLVFSSAADRDSHVLLSASWFVSAFLDLHILLFPNKVAS